MSRARDFADLAGSADAGGLTGRNLIINGAMTIDQRNSGSALTVNTASEFYAVDRFMGIGVASDGVYTLQQVTDAPDNFVNSIKATVTTADASIPTTGRYLIRHKLEGNVISQLNLGSSAAQTFTLSFYVKSSLTGTFGGSVLNGAQDRSYPFTYTISSLPQAQILGNAKQLQLLAIQPELGLQIILRQCKLRGHWVSVLIISTQQVLG